MARYITSSLLAAAALLTTALFAVDADTVSDWARPSLVVSATQ